MRPPSDSAFPSRGIDEQAKKRSAIRITVKNLAVRIPRLKKIFKVSDISATGLGFIFEKPRIKAGVELKMDIILDKEDRGQKRDLQSQTP